MAETRTNEEELERAFILRQMKKTYPKLVLWHTKYFNPLSTHEHLLPIMETLGFVALPLSPTKNTKFGGLEVPWIEYKYCGASAITTKTGPFRSNPLLAIQKPPPTPKLPYPYIDGLHLYTYRAFLNAVDFYIDNKFSDNVFLLQGLPANLDDTELDPWHYVQEIKTLVRKGTLDPALTDIYSSDDAVDMNSFKILPAKEDFLVHDDTEEEETNSTSLIHHHPPTNSKYDIYIYN